MTRAKSRRRRRMARERAAIQSAAHPEYTHVDPDALAAETWQMIPTSPKEDKS